RGEDGVHVAVGHPALDRRRRRRCLRRWTGKHIGRRHGGDGGEHSDSTTGHGATPGGNQKESGVPGDRPEASSRSPGTWGEIQRSVFCSVNRDGLSQNGRSSRGRIGGNRSGRIAPSTP